jgi:hypothetical protein
MKKLWLLSAIICFGINNSSAQKTRNEFRFGLKIG